MLSIQVQREIADKISKLEQYHAYQIFLIIQKWQPDISRNTSENNEYFNFADLSEKTIAEIQSYLKFIDENPNYLKELEKEREDLLREYRKDLAEDKTVENKTLYTSRKNFDPIKIIETHSVLSIIYSAVQKKSTVVKNWVDENINENTSDDEDKKLKKKNKKNRLKKIPENITRIQNVMKKHIRVFKKNKYETHYAERSEMVSEETENDETYDMEIDTNNNDADETDNEENYNFDDNPEEMVEDNNSEIQTSEEILKNDKSSTGHDDDSSVIEIDGTDININNVEGLFSDDEDEALSEDNSEVFQMKIIKKPRQNQNKPNHEIDLSSIKTNISESTVQAPNVKIEKVKIYARKIHNLHINNLLETYEDW